MHLNILDVIVEINGRRRKEGPVTPDIPVTPGSILLCDRDGAYLKTADGFYLAVSER